MSETEILHKIFPTLKTTVFSRLDQVKFYKARYSPAEIKSMGPEHVQSVFDRYHRENNCIIYGGWLENWEEILNVNSYLEGTGRYIHLGVDIEVPEGTPVHTPVSGTVVNIFHDTDTECGWGTRVILRPDKEEAPYLLFAHMKRTLWYSEGEHLARGKLVGYIATWPDNGNTEQHLHIQAISRAYFQTPGNLEELDGYGDVNDKTLKESFPEPLEAIEKILKG